MTKLADHLNKMRTRSHELDGVSIHCSQEVGDALFLVLEDGTWNCSRFGASEILSRYRLRSNYDGEYPKDTPIMEDCPFVVHGFATILQLEEHFADERDENARKEKEDRRRFYEQLKAEFEGKDG